MNGQPTKGSSYIAFCQESNRSTGPYYTNCIIQGSLLHNQNSGAMVSLTKSPFWQDRWQWNSSRDFLDTALDGETLRLGNGHTAGKPTTLPASQSLAVFQVTMSRSSRVDLRLQQSVPMRGSVNATQKSLLKLSQSYVEAALLGYMLSRGLSTLMHTGVFARHISKLELGVGLFCGGWG